MRFLVVRTWNCRSQEVVAIVIVVWSCLLQFSSAQLYIEGIPLQSNQCLVDVFKSNVLQFNFR